MFYSRLNGFMSSVSTFVLAWCLLAGYISVSVLSTCFLVFFIIVAGLSWFIDLGMWQIEKSNK